VHIGSRAVLGAKAGVSNDVPEGARMIGIPATPEREQKIKQAVLSKLPEMRQQLKKLQRLVESIAVRLGMGEGLSIAGNDGESNPEQRRAVA
jgi:UDP-3-O-[3-hydroxymyristoyl] glucosamine N-acyltransferase